MTSNVALFAEAKISRLSDEIQRSHQCAALEEWCDHYALITADGQVIISRIRGDRNDYEKIAALEYLVQVMKERS